MYCPKCGTNLAEGAAFCHNCGYSIASVSQGYAPAASPLDNTKKSLSNPLFLAICILLTVSAGIGIFLASFDVLLILIVIGVWLAYAGATGENTKLIGSGIKLTSVAVKIGYVITFISAGLLIFAGIILFISFAAIGNMLGDVSELSYEIFEEIAAEMNLDFEATGVVRDILDKILPILGSMSGMVLGVIFFTITLICCGVAILINILFTGRFSKFLSNAVRAFNEARPIELNDRSTATRILIYGIFMAIGVLPAFATPVGFFSLISRGAIVAACIIAFVMMKKED